MAVCTPAINQLMPKFKQKTKKGKGSSRREDERQEAKHIIKDSGMII